jgi:drug/metabolite transporter (DMT)-like permease
MLFAATASNAGFNMQKLSQRQKKQGVKSWNAVWWGGMGCIALAGIADFVALEFGDVTLVTPLGSLTLIANVFMANWFHGEKLYVRDGICTAIILAGNIITVIFAPHTEENFSLDDLWTILTSARFTVFVIVIVLILCAGSAFATYATNVSRLHGHASAQYKKIERAHSIIYPFIGGVYGSQSVTFINAVLVILTSTFSHPDSVIFLAVWQFWPLVILVVTCIVMQMFMMNIGLAKWDAMVIVPVFQSTWTLVSIVSGAIVYNEFNAFNDCPSQGGSAICAGDFGLSWIFFFVGLVTSVIGVFLLSKRESNQQQERDETKQGARKQQLLQRSSTADSIDGNDDNTVYVSADSMDDCDTKLVNGTIPDDTIQVKEVGHETEESKDAKKVSGFQTFKEFTVHGAAFADSTLAVRTIVVDNKSTDQRWPFTVLLIKSLGRNEHVSQAVDGSDFSNDDFETDAARVNHLQRFDIVHTIDGKFVWTPHEVSIDVLTDQLRMASSVGIRRIDDMLFDKWDQWPVAACCRPKDEPSMFARITVAIDRLTKWQLPVVALIQERTFANILNENDENDDPGIMTEVAINMPISKHDESLSGTERRLDIIDDFEVNRRIAWRRTHLCGLAEYKNVSPRLLQAQQDVTNKKEIQKNEIDNEQNPALADNDFTL